MVRYYGYYSNVSRGKRQMVGRDDGFPCILEPQGNAKAFRKNWARLIQKIRTCPREGVVMTTQEELRIAFEEYQNGTFIKHKK